MFVVYVLKSKTSYIASYITVAGVQSVYSAVAVWWLETQLSDLEFIVVDAQSVVGRRVGSRSRALVASTVEHVRDAQTSHRPQVFGV